MFKTSHRLRPAVDTLDVRLVMSASSATSGIISAAVIEPPTHLVPGSHPSANTNRTFTSADLLAYAAAYESYQGASDFTPQYDFNGTGFIGQNDATPILRGLADVTPKIPLKLTLSLAPGEQVQGHHPTSNGVVTRDPTVTVIGKTTPNSIIFIDGPTSSPHSQPTPDFKFEGGAVASNAQGYFSYTLTLNPESDGGSITSPVYLIRTPYNQQLIRVYPILRIR